MAKSSAPLKSAAIVFGALAFAWLTIELAFKPLLDKARSSLDKSDPTRDPDDVDPEKVLPAGSDDQVEGADASNSNEAGDKS